MFHTITTLTHHFAVTCGGSGGFFNFPTWYEYLKAGKAAQGEKCAIDFTFPADIPLVVLALLDILLRIAGIAAIAFVVWGGIQYVTSQGEPDATAHAKGTIINALIGLVVATLAVAIVQFIGNKVG